MYFSLLGIVVDVFDVWLFCCFFIRFVYVFTLLTFVLSCCGPRGLTKFAGPTAQRRVRSSTILGVCNDLLIIFDLGAAPGTLEPFGDRPGGQPERLWRPLGAHGPIFLDYSTPRSGIEKSAAPGRGWLGVVRLRSQYQSQIPKDFPPPPSADGPGRRKTGKVEAIV